MSAPVNGALGGSDRAARGEERMLNSMQQPEAGRAPAPAELERTKPEAREAPPREASPREAPPMDRPPAARPRAQAAPTEITVTELAWSLLRRRWTLLAVAGLVVGLAGLFLFLAPRVWESAVLIQVEGRSGPVAGFQDLAALFEQGTPTEGEMRIMKSRPLLETVVDDLGLDLEVRPRTLPVVGAAVARRYTGTEPASAPAGLERWAWGGERLRVSRLTVPRALLDRPLTLTALPGGRYRLASEDGAVLVEGEVGQAVEAADRGVAVRVAELTARPGTAFELLKKPRLEIVEGLQQDLRISEQGTETGLVEVRLAGRDPVRVAAALEAIAAGYLRQNVERTSAEAANTLAVLEKQLPVLKASVDLAERSLNAFQRRNGTVNLSLEGQTMLQRIVEIDRTIAESEIRASELTQRYADRHPDVAVLAETARRLQAQRAAMEARLRTLPDLELEAARLTRQATVATELYLSVLNRTEELRIAKSRWIGNARVLEHAAVPYRPTSPKPGLVLTLGVLLGLVAGAASALARDAAKRGVADPDELESGTGLDVFATIPRSATQRKLARRAKREAQPALAIAKPTDPAVEDLRDLRTSVQFALRQARNNVVGVSGLAPGAGKSFVSVNLAHLLAAAEGRVLLVDADLRRGDLHRQFGVEAQPGLADVLSGAVQADAVIRQTAVPNLDLLTAGSLPANPGELLAGGRLQQLLAEVGRRYGVVVVDTPPILSVADSALVGRHAGLNLLVIRAGVHSTDEISFALRRLSRGGVLVRGAVLNDLRPSMARYGRSGRYRRYELDPRRAEAPSTTTAH
jgi:tyrosine-protein kinase Etk/Wzc